MRGFFMSDIVRFRDGLPNFLEEYLKGSISFYVDEVKYVILALCCGYSDPEKGATPFAVPKHVERSMVGVA